LAYTNPHRAHVACRIDDCPKSKHICVRLFSASPIARASARAFPSPPSPALVVDLAIVAARDFVADAVARRVSVAVSARPRFLRRAYVIVGVRPRASSSSSSSSFGVAYVRHRAARGRARVCGDAGRRAASHHSSARRIGRCDDATRRDARARTRERTRATRARRAATTPDEGDVARRGRDAEEMRLGQRRNRRRAREQRRAREGARSRTFPMRKI
jgi:hypothetical protein